jgi:hypothetical protein
MCDIVVVYLLGMHSAAPVHSPPVQRSRCSVSWGVSVFRNNDNNNRPSGKSPKHVVHTKVPTGMIPSVRQNSPGSVDLLETNQRRIPCQNRN